MDDSRNRFTKELLSRSGIRENMRVLDIGCGTGEVSFLLAKLMNGTGEVIGIDKDEVSISFGTTKAKREDITNITFINKAIEDFLCNEEHLFDAIVGRRVLMYLQDPLDAIILAKKLLKPNGLMIFQESAAVGSEGQNK